jgi:hypothetical protein
MIPMLAVVRWRTHGGRRLGVWIPLILLWLLLLPVIVILLPVAILVLAIAGSNPFRVIGAVWRLLAALRGTRIDFASRASSLFISIL